jgi:hypothetical protein
MDGGAIGARDPSQHWLAGSMLTGYQPRVFHGRRYAIAIQRIDLALDELTRYAPNPAMPRSISERNLNTWIVLLGVSRATVYRVLSEDGG